MKLWTNRGKLWILCIKVTTHTCLSQSLPLTHHAHVVIDSRAKNRNLKEQSDISQSGGAVHASLFEEIPRNSKGKTSSRKSHKLTPAQLREHEEQKEKDVVRGYKRVEELWAKMLDDTDQGRQEAEREWMFEAEKLVEMFRETRMLFLSTRVCLRCRIFFLAQLYQAC
jgi:hypothetical protein